MTDVLPASETIDLPPLPRGWHVVTYAVLAEGALAILGSKFDVRALLALWRDPERSAEPANPFKGGTGVSARIWTFDGARLTDGPAFPLLTPHPKFDRFPDGRWLIASSRSSNKPLSRVLSANGGEVRRVHLGDGINHVQVDDVGYIWVGWFDEGVFGNQGFMGDPLWSHPDLPYAPSQHGLAAFDEHGRLTAQAPFEAHIADCYALNVAGDTAWACTYTDFPILSVAVGKPSRLWTTKLSGPSAIAVRPPHLLIASGYMEASDRVVLARLEPEAAEPLREWKLPFETRNETRPNLFAGRGEVLHIIRNGRWHRWRIGDALGT